MKTRFQSSYTLKEVAELLQVSEQSVRRMRDRGRIKALSLGLRSVRFAKSDIDTLLKAPETR